MKVAAAILLLLALTGCASQTYYACREDGRSREFCAGLPGSPRV
jgi:hypothetical protein